MTYKIGLGASDKKGKRYLCVFEDGRKTGAWLQIFYKDHNSNLYPNDKKGFTLMLDNLKKNPRLGKILKAAFNYISKNPKQLPREVDQFSEKFLADMAVPMPEIEYARWITFKKIIQQIEKDIDLKEKNRASEKESTKQLEKTLEKTEISEKLRTANGSLTKRKEERKKANSGMKEIVASILSDKQSLRTTEYSSAETERKITQLQEILSKIETEIKKEKSKKESYEKTHITNTGWLGPLRLELEKKQKRKEDLIKHLTMQNKDLDRIDGEYTKMWEKYTKSMDDLIRPSKRHKKEAPAKNKTQRKELNLIIEARASALKKTIKTGELVCENIDCMEKLIQQIIIHERKVEESSRGLKVARLQIEKLNAKKLEEAPVLAHLSGDAGAMKKKSVELNKSLSSQRIKTQNLRGEMRKIDKSITLLIGEIRRLSESLPSMKSPPADPRKKRRLQEKTLQVPAKEPAEDTSSVFWGRTKEPAEDTSSVFWGRTKEPAEDTSSVFWGRTKEPAEDTSSDEDGATWTF